MNGPHNKDQMHPEDMRNLLIFLILSTIVFFAYKSFVADPQAEVQKQVRIAEQKAMAENPEAFKGPELKERDAVLSSGGGRFEFDNGEIYGSISLRGGRIDDIAFHNYYETLDKKKNVVLLSPKSTKLPRYIDYGWVAKSKNISVPDAKTRWQIRGNKDLRPDAPVTLVWTSPQGLKFEREISIDDRYLFTITQRVINNSGKEVSLHPYGLVSQAGIPQNFRKVWFMHEGPIGWNGDELREVNYKDLRKEGGKTFRGIGGWTGITEKYWLAALLPAQDQSVKYSYNFTAERNPEDKDYGRYQADFVGPALTLAPGESAESTSHAFTGAKKVLTLTDYGQQLGTRNFDLAVDFGWLWFLSKPFFYALHYLGQFTGNLGVAIIILTIMIRTAVFPLTNTSYRSFAKMKKVSPQITELREKYGEDKARLQEELMKMYQREGVNPMAGCAPILLQIPIFFALYKTLFVTIEMRHAPFFGWIKDLSAPDPTSIFNLFGLIPWDTPGFLTIGVWPCLMLIAMIIQRKLNPPPQDPLQRDMARYFPFVITYILSRFSSGLVVYWTFSAFIGVIQQMIIMRSLDVPIHLFGETKEEKELNEAIDKGPAVHPLAEMAEDEIEEAMFEHHEEEKPKKITPPKPKKSKKKKK